jgi:hypothetical protein
METTTITTGALVQDAIELTNQGSFERAYFSASGAVAATVSKITGTEGVSEIGILRFIKENFPLISFMGMPRAMPIPLSLPFQIKKVMPQFNVHFGPEEITAMVVTETLKLGMLPDTFGAGSGGEFEVRDGRLWLPSGLVCGLLGSVIFNPVNAGETIAEECWISISDFKMFVSELFGRQDLAARIMKFYLG